MSSLGGAKITTDGNGIGPLYAARSWDGGSTWDMPRPFDRFGVWPQLLTLQNGVTLACYGRPGLYIRAAGGPDAREWGRRLSVVSPGKIGADTCSYADLLALNDHEALLVYSDFNVMNPQGELCKAILARRVTL